MNSDIRGELWGVIVNPYSGKRQLAKDWIKIYRLLKKADIRFDEQLTAYPGHATEIAKNMVEHGYKHLLVVGGDGTINEVVNGVYTSNTDYKSEITLALVPYGTGNDWARYWKITRNYRQLARHLFQRKSVSVDIGKMTYVNANNDEEHRFFINGAGMGFDGMVVKITNHIKQFLGGSSWVYSLSVFLALFKLKPYHMRLIADDKTMEQKIITIAIGNTCYSGGGLKQAPEAIPTDGLFHITAIEPLKLTEIPSALRCLFQGKLTDHKRAHSFVTKRFVVETPSKIYAETDGILIDAKSPYTIEIIPQALHMLIP